MDNLYTLSTKIAGDIFCIKSNGGLSMDLLKYLIKRIEDLESNIEHPVHRFMDMTGLTAINIYYNNLSSLVKIWHDAFKKYDESIIKVAVFADSDFSYGMAGMYQALMSADNVKRKRHITFQLYAASEAYIEMEVLSKLIKLFQ